MWCSNLLFYLTRHTQEESYHLHTHTHTHTSERTNTHTMASLHICIYSYYLNLLMLPFPCSKSRILSKGLISSGCKASLPIIPLFRLILTACIISCVGEEDEGVKVHVLYIFGGSSFFSGTCHSNLIFFIFLCLIICQIQTTLFCHFYQWSRL